MHVATHLRAQPCTSRPRSPPKAAARLDSDSPPGQVVHRERQHCGLCKLTRVVEQTLPPGSGAGPSLWMLCLKLPWHPRWQTAQKEGNAAHLKIAAAVCCSACRRPAVQLPMRTRPDDWPCVSERCQGISADMTQLVRVCQRTEDGQATAVGRQHS